MIYNILLNVLLRSYLRSYVRRYMYERRYQPRTRKSVFGLNASMIASKQPNIYLDLESISATNRRHSRNTELISELRRLVAENRQLLRRVRRLEKACAGHRVSNLAIEQNISCLFNTAVMVRRHPASESRSFYRHHQCFRRSQEEMKKYFASERS